MTLETFLLWVAVGAIAGFLASRAMGAGYGLLQDILIGVVGAFIGGVVFRLMRWHAPFSGFAGTVTIAFLGAVLLLVVLRVARRRQV